MGAFKQLSVTFVNEEPDTVELLFEGSVLETIEPQAERTYTTYAGHEWKARVLGSTEVFWKLQVDAEKHEEYRAVITRRSNNKDEL